ncbi:uncharacterized protein LTR77_003656 [Saxophila tyrrhenica]|uniref:RTA1 like protein n=1 Tax=Saxophila tyrrhenica TaxID=1690608 RepID=A0AAV9PHR0_9PEZI|nr:hypothetical protein LTR77_003656 [Saxophila tyrrhenica]
MSRPYEGYVDPDFPNPGGPNSARIIIYGYTPALALGVLGVVLFFVALVAHCYLLFRHRTWYFSTVAVGTVMEIIGYVFRLLSSQQNPYSVPWFVAQYFCIVVAPVSFSAAIYTVVSVLVNTYGRQYSPMPPKAILGIFITCDVVATIVQVAGAALVGTAYSNQDDPSTPNNILLAGLAFQVFSFFVFLVILAWTLWKARQSSVSVARSFLVALVIATLAVYLRTCFRLAETAEGLMQTLSTHEVFFGCLEFAPIVVAVYLFTWWHPGPWLSATPNSGSKRHEGAATAS